MISEQGRVAKGTPNTWQHRDPEKKRAGVQFSREKRGPEQRLYLLGTAQEPQMADMAPVCVDKRNSRTQGRPLHGAWSNDASRRAADTCLCPFALTPHDCLSWPGAFSGSWS